MKKLILLIAWSCLIFIYPVNSTVLKMGLGIDYSVFNDQNQIIAIFNSPTREYDFLVNMSLINLSIGLRTSIINKTNLIWKLSLIEGNNIYPLIIKQNNSDILLYSTASDYPTWYYVFGGSILNFDKANIENFIIHWMQLRFGVGYNTYKLKKDDQINFIGSIATKLGLGTYNFGENNFQSFNSYNKYFTGLESGLSLLLGLSYGRVVILKSNLDYTFVITNRMINKLSYGFVFDYFLYSPVFVNKNSNSNFFKFSIGVNKNKYYFEDKSKEFLKYDFSIKYIIPN